MFAREICLGLLLPLFAALSLSIGGCRTVPASKAPQRSLQEAIRAGVDFLIARQNKDGSWGSFESARPYEIYLDTIASHDAFRNATSALCCMALMEVASEREDARRALERGLVYLINEEPVFRATGTTFYHTWAQVYVLQCMARALACPAVTVERAQLHETATKWLKTLEAMQGADGGWGYYDFGYGLRRPSGFLSTSFLTGSALWAIWEAEQNGIEVPTVTKRAAILAVTRLRTADKTYVYSTEDRFYPGWEVNRPKGALGRSHAPNLALFLYEAGVSQEDCMLGLDRMFQEHHFLAMARCRPWPHEAWYYNSGYYFLYGYFNAAGVISRLVQENQRKYWELTVSNLLPLQEADGSWWDFPFYGYHKEYGTAFALLTLLPAARYLERAGKKECASL